METDFEIKKERIYFGNLEISKPYNKLNQEYADRIAQYVLLKKSHEFIRQFITQECIPVIKQKAGYGTDKLTVQSTYLSKFKIFLQGKFPQLPEDIFQMIKLPRDEREIIKQQVKKKVEHKNTHQRIIPVTLI
jgi:hypothetical protein